MSKGESGGDEVGGAGGPTGQCAQRAGWGWGWIPDPGIELKSLVAPTLAGGFFTMEPPGLGGHDSTHNAC